MLRKYSTKEYRKNNMKYSNNKKYSTEKSTNNRSITNYYYNIKENKAIY